MLQHAPRALSRRFFALTHLCEIHRSVAVGVNFVDHVLQLGLGGVLAKGAHHGAEFFDGDGAIAVLVEEGEGLLELCERDMGEVRGTVSTSCDQLSSRERHRIRTSDLLCYRMICGVGRRGCGRIGQSRRASRSHRLQSCATCLYEPSVCERGMRAVGWQNVSGMVRRESRAWAGWLFVDEWNVRLRSCDSSFGRRCCDDTEKLSPPSPVSSPPSFAHKEGAEPIRPVTTRLLHTLVACLRFCLSTPSLIGASHRIALHDMAWQLTNWSAIV